MQGGGVNFLGLHGGKSKQGWWGMDGKGTFTIFLSSSNIIVSKNASKQFG